MPKQKMTVGVVGLGLMGTSIAACLVRSGYAVIGLDRQPEAVRRAAEAVRKALREVGRSSARGFRATSALEELKRCGFVVEAIVENARNKRGLIAELEAVLSPRAVIASNTSAIPITRLQAGARRPGRIVGMHWAEPAHLTRFMEIVCGEKTSPAARRLAVEVARRCGKEPSVLRKDVRGFVTNRIFYAMLREAFHLVDSGVCTVADVDRSLRNDLGWWMTLAGPFRYMDLTGVPAYATVMKDLWPELSNATAVPRLMRRVVGSGALGVRNAKGFYRYTPAEAKAWERRFVRFTQDVRALALKYPEGRR